MKTLMQQETVNWPQIEPLKNLDLVSQDLDEGPWAMAMTPMFFARKNKILEVEYRPRESLSSSAPEYYASLDKAKATRVFRAQLGRPFKGVDKMPIHRQALFAIFIARACRDSGAAATLMTQLARSISRTGKLDCTGVKLLWKKHLNNPLVKELCAMHSYELTLMAGALALARNDGVVAVADFIWLKPLDRRLWYTLNSVGRQTPFVEAAGVYGHWLAERAVRRGLNVPVVHEAVKALEIALNEIIYQPESEEEKQQLKEAYQAKS